MFFPSPLNYCFEAIIRGASTFVKIQHFKHWAKCHYSVHLPLSSICSVLEGRAGQENMNIWLTADKQMSAVDGVNSMNPPHLPRTIHGGDPRDAETTRLVCKGSRSLSFSITKWCHQRWDLFLKYSQFFQKDLVLFISSSPFHLLVQLCDQLVLKLKAEAEFPGECYILRRGHERHPANFSRFDPTPLLKCKLIPAYREEDPTSHHPLISKLSKVACATLSFALYLRKKITPNIIISSQLCIQK